jgi:hypothetical protein
MPKKWPGHRQADGRDGEPLTNENVGNSAVPERVPGWRSASIASGNVNAKKCG